VIAASVVLAASAGVCAAVAIVGLAEGAREVGVRRAERRRARRRPAVVALAVAVARPLAVRAAGRRDVAARLDAAGRPLGLSVADVLALEAGGGLAAGLLALSTASLAPGRLGLLLLVVAPAAGFAAPTLLLARAARARAARIDLELPDVAELLRVAIDAGLPPLRALAEVGRRHPGLLAAELGAVHARTELGVPRDDALDRLVRRAPTPGVSALVAALRRSARHGSPLGPALGAIAADARAERTRRIRDTAARAAPKVQLVVALLLVPAVLLLVAAALAASLT
jgi:tight adherence protein C